MELGLVLACSLAAMSSVACCGARPDEAPPARPPSVTNYGYKVVQAYPHDRRSFTQGLVYENGVLYEGTGLYGQSALIRRDLKTGRALKTTRLPRRHFGEGITIVPDTQQRWGGDRIIQLTWKSKIGFVYRKDTFTLLKEFSYATEGWGITYDGKRLIYSDGTATLHFLDPNTFAETGRVEVRDRGRPVQGLNELEFIPAKTAPSEKEQNSDEKAGGWRLEAGGASGLPPAVCGLLFANVWPTDEIVVIDPKTGLVVGRLDMSALYPRPDDSEDVLNGIAWLPHSGHLLVTGKLWPKLYEIELTEKTP